MNRTITSNVTETVILKIPTNKSPGQDGFTDEFYRTSREGLMSIFPKLLQKTAKEGTLTNSFYMTTIILIPKLGKDSTKQGNYMPISLMNTSKRLQQNTSTKCNNALKESYTMIKWGCIPEIRHEVL